MYMCSWISTRWKWQLHKYRILFYIDNDLKFFLSIDINECAESSTTCDSNSRCEDRNGSFACCINRITQECIGKIFKAKKNKPIN